MSRAPTSDQPPLLRSYAVALACALSIGGLAAGVPTASAQGVPDSPTPPSAPAPPGTPTAPGTPVPPDPGDPEEEPPAPDDEGPSAPGSSAEPRPLSPFPVVVIAGRQQGRATRVSELRVRGPRNALVVIRCLRPRCPMRRAARRIPSSGRLRLRRAEGVYLAGSSIEIRVTARNRIGKYTKITFRSGRTPVRDDSCLQPGRRRPSPCPG